MPLVEKVARRSAYLVLLSENPGALQRLLSLCAASPWIAEQIARFPLLLDELLNEGRLFSPPQGEELVAELRERLMRIPEDDLEQQMEALRHFKLAHRLRVAASEIAGSLPLMKVSDYLTWLAEAILQQVLQLAWRQLTSKHGVPRRSDGSLYAAASTINAVSDESGQVTHYINVFSDITERKHHQEHLERQAHFDPLTRLPNRALLPDRLAQAMARACSEQHGLAVCFLDLDGFKAVNDTHGHEAGDELLVIVAQRLQAHIRTGDTAARLGGDEFVVLLCDLRDLHECEQMAQRLLRAICEPMVVEGHTVQVGASMGIALYPQHGSQAEQLLRLADQAMYQAKQSGRNRCIFHAIEGESAQRVVLR